MNALTPEETGKYVNRHFVSSFQRVGTFRIRGNNKQGGNVASYFCTPEGRVIHFIAGPVEADELIREARWAVETWKLALLEHPIDMKEQQQFLRLSHLDRLRKDHRVNIRSLRLPILEDVEGAEPIDDSILDRPRGHRRNLNNAAKANQLLAAYPLVRLGRIYNLVFDEILNEKISTVPVDKK